MCNVYTGMVPSYIQDLIPTVVSGISDYPLRNNRNISVPLNRTSNSQKNVFHNPLGYGILLRIIFKIYQHCPPLKKLKSKRLEYQMCLPTLLLEIDICLSYMHD